MKPLKTAVYRKESFNAAHRLNSIYLSEAENQSTFGKCNNPNYHGHNYTLIVKVVGSIDKKTGYVIDMKYLSALIKEEIIERFDHKNLNLDTEEFKVLNPTAENIASVVYAILRSKLHDRYELTIQLYETEKNYVEYPA